MQETLTSRLVRIGVVIGAIAVAKKPTSVKKFVSLTWFSLPIVVGILVRSARAEVAAVVAVALHKYRGK